MWRFFCLRSCHGAGGEADPRLEGLGGGELPAWLRGERRVNWSDCGVGDREAEAILDLGCAARGGVAG